MKRRLRGSRIFAPITTPAPSYAGMFRAIRRIPLAYPCAPLGGREREGDSGSSKRRARAVSSIRYYVGRRFGRFRRLWGFRENRKVWQRFRPRRCSYCSTRWGLSLRFTHASGCAWPDMFLLVGTPPLGHVGNTFTQTESLCEFSIVMDLLVFLLRVGFRLFNRL